MLKIVNFEAGDFSAVAKQLLQQKFHYSEITWDNFPADGFANADIIIVRFKKFIDKNIIAQFPKLKIIFTATTGTDHIDTAHCKEKGIEIFCLKPYTEFLKTIPSTAEHAFGLLLSLVRNIPAAARSVKDGKWERELFFGHQLQNKKIGIAGMGRTGSLMAHYATAFKMQVFYFDPYVDLQNEYIKVSSMNELIKNTDVISLHVHLNEETFHLINDSQEKYFAREKYLINTSRGKIVDEKFVCMLLKEKKIAGIATDVVETELDNLRESQLYQASQKCENIIITPHIGGATYEALHSCEEFLCNELVKHTGV